MRARITEGKLLVRVKLKGKRFNAFEDALIDTGAAFTVIPPAIAEFLELEPNREMPKAVLVTASGLIEVPVKTLDRIEVDGVTVDDLSVVVHKIPDPAPIKVLLGMNFIKSVKLVVDGKKNQLKIEDP